MTFVPKTGNAALVTLVSGLVAILLGLEWWSRRERASAARDSAGAAGDSPDTADPAPHATPHPSE